MVQLQREVSGKIASVLTQGAGKDVASLWPLFFGLILSTRGTSLRAGALSFPTVT